MRLTQITYLSHKTEISLQTKRTFTSLDERLNNDCSNLQVSQEEKTLPLPCHKNEERQWESAFRVSWKATWKIGHLMDLMQGREGNDDRRQLVSRSWLTAANIIRFKHFEVSAGPLLILTPVWLASSLDQLLHLVELGFKAARLNMLTNAGGRGRLMSVASLTRTTSCWNS